MRAARRIIVLAGILALAVCAPITWTQAGAQSEGDGESPPEITFVKIMCADFGAIPANVNTPNDLSRATRSTTLGQSIGETAVGEENAPRRLRAGRGLAVRARLRPTTSITDPHGEPGTWSIRPSSTSPARSR